MWGTNQLDKELQFVIFAVLNHPEPSLFLMISYVADRCTDVSRKLEHVSLVKTGTCPFQWIIQESSAGKLQVFYIQTWCVLTKTP